ncbi:conjugal transfer protein TrbD [Shewanella algae]|jgi:type IV secretion system protein VirB3|uniref:conjugal transfer protein TrbD n=1 Tax=Shewanella algae TaxID=38313 RepID=UPI001182C7FB|nr:conjugal transfer protein TrbD [Shewanella algae]MBO2558938.1 VirB3 family type IV secretion system protein [Shewanella algae]MBO2575909.1 VirB3 family type IV secretion system protein [Shewanella algae]
MSTPRLRSSPFFRFHRASLFLGGERGPVLLTFFLAFFLIFVLQNMYSALLGVFIWSLLMPLNVYMARLDPKLFEVFSRYSKYQKYYPPHSCKNFRGK